MHSSVHLGPNPWCHTGMFSGAPSSEQKGLSWEEGKRRAGGETFSPSKRLLMEFRVLEVRKTGCGCGGFKASDEYLGGCRTPGSATLSLGRLHLFSGAVCVLSPKHGTSPGKSSWDAGSELWASHWHTQLPVLSQLLRVILSSLAREFLGFGFCFLAFSRS